MFTVDSVSALVDELVPFMLNGNIIITSSYVNSVPETQSSIVNELGINFSAQE